MVREAESTFSGLWSEEQSEQEQKREREEEL